MAAKFIDIGGVKHIQITFPVEQPRMSSTGKTYIVGYTNELTTLEVDGKAIKIMAQATIRNEAMPKGNSSDINDIVAKAVAAALAARK